MLRHKEKDISVCKVAFPARYFVFVTVSWRFFQFWGFWDWIFFLYRLFPIFKFLRLVFHKQTTKMIWKSLFTELLILYENYILHWFCFLWHCFKYLFFFQISCLRLNFLSVIVYFHFSRSRNWLFTRIGWTPA